MEKCEEVVINRRAGRNCTIIDIKGAIRVTNLLGIKECFENELKAETKHIALNFKEVDFIESSGIGIIVNFHKRVQGIGGELCLFAVQEKILSALQNTNVTRVLDIVDSESDLELVFPDG